VTSATESAQAPGSPAVGERRKPQKYIAGSILILQRNMDILGSSQGCGEAADGRGRGWREGRESAQEASSAMGHIGALFVPLLVVDHRQGSGEVKHGLGQGHPQEQTDLHGAQADRLGREQHQPIVLAAQGRARVWR
jgi:hypothetical protein